MATPCSVKANGRYFESWFLFKVTNCDLKVSFSSMVSSNKKSSGNRQKQAHDKNAEKEPKNIAIELFRLIYTFT